jgi:hypothetical protein
MEPVTHIEQMGKRADFLLENLKGKHHSGDRAIDGRIILKWILK